MTKNANNTLSKEILSATLETFVPVVAGKDQDERHELLKTAAKNANRVTDLTEARATLDMVHTGQKRMLKTKRRMFEDLLPGLDAKLKEIGGEITTLGEDLNSWMVKRVDDARKTITLSSSKILKPHADVIKLFTWQRAANIRVDFVLVHSLSRESEFKQRTWSQFSPATLCSLPNNSVPELYFCIAPELFFGDTKQVSFAPLFERASALEKDKDFIRMYKRLRELDAAGKKVSRERDLVAKKASVSHMEDQLEESDEAARVELYGRVVGQDFNALAERKAKELLDQEIDEIKKAVNKG